MNAPREEKNYKELPGPIMEGDKCVCNFKDAGLSWWFERDEILTVRRVEKNQNIPDTLYFEGLHTPFYANNFIKVETLPSKEKKEEMDTSLIEQEISRLEALLTDARQRRQDIAEGLKGLEIERKKLELEDLEEIEKEAALIWGIERGRKMVEKSPNEGL